MTYIGAGMICSHLVNLSLLLGAVLSWGIMWPLITGLKGDWFPKTLPESSMKSLNGYKVCQSTSYYSLYLKSLISEVTDNFKVDDTQ